MRFFFEIPQQQHSSAAEVSEDQDLLPPPEFQIRPNSPEPRIGSVHQPVAQRDCRSCHDPQSRMQVRSDAIDCCRSCHPRYFGTEVGHMPVSYRFCQECHTPHRSPHVYLLTQPLFDMCVRCHQRPEMLSPASHSGAGVENCTRCHDPHFGRGPLLRGES